MKRNKPKLKKNSRADRRPRRRSKSRRRPTSAKRAAPKPQVTPDTLRRDWDRLTSLEKGERLKQLVRQGTSRRHLAKEIGRSESVVRKLIQLADAPAADREALRSGQLGVRAALRRARRRRAAAQRAGLSLSPEEREKKVKEGAQLATRFIDEEVPLIYRDQFVGEIKYAWHSLHPRHAQWCAAAPKQHRVSPRKVPEGIIRDCRPGGGKPSNGVDQINYCFAWFARWTQQVFPDPQVCQDVLFSIR